MIWTRYYTPNIIAKLMVDLIDIKNPTSVTDICVGSWNLLAMAQKRWNNIELYGVDIDDNSRQHELKDSTFLNMDGRAFALECIETERKFKVVLANPPFGKEILKNHVKYTKLPGYQSMTKKALQRIETTMLLANLSVLDAGGYLAAIVPNTLIDGDWAKCLRTYISSHFELKCVVRLPSSVFGRDINTSVIVVSNTGHSLKPVKVYECMLNINGYSTQFKHYVDSGHVVQGNWVHAWAHAQSNLLSLGRGRIDSSQLNNCGKQAVLHSTDIQSLREGNWKPTKFSKEIIVRNTKCASYGDIVFIRVGRNSGLAARITQDIKVPISDCVLLLKYTETELIDKIWNLINTPFFEQDLVKLRKGVSTRYITVKSLKDYFLNQITSEEEGDLA